MFFGSITWHGSDEQSVEENAWWDRVAQKVLQQAKVLLESWEVKTYEQPSSQHFNPALPNTNYKENPAFRNQPSRADYEQYSWLFGCGKRWFINWSIYH